MTGNSGGEKREERMSTSAREVIFSDSESGLGGGEPASFVTS